MESRSGRFITRKRAFSTHWIGCWIGSRTDVDVQAGERLTLTGTKSRPTNKQPVTLLTELSRRIKMNSRSDKTKCEGSVNASGTINKKWLELIWLLYIRCKTKDVICYQRYNDPSQGLLQSLTFTTSIWATHKYNRGTARNTKEDKAEISSVPPRYTTWSTVKPFAVQCCHRTVTKSDEASDFPPTQQSADKSLARQPGYQNSMRHRGPAGRRYCSHTVLAHGTALKVYAKEEKSVAEGSDDRLLRCPALFLFNPTQQTSLHPSTWRPKQIQVPKRCVIFLDKRRRTKSPYLAILQRNQEERTKDELILASAWSW